ncbi:MULTISPECIES: hypothetical protein [Burkholderia]|uniref:hypothetical protein n=1 Tax=Burkholderia TaxID=32008 RepID=UPI00126A6CB5|nr:MULTISPECIES: hypothetical protein [Burkholderia]
MVDANRARRDARRGLAARCGRVRTARLHDSVRTKSVRRDRRMASAAKRGYFGIGRRGGGDADAMQFIRKRDAMTYAA